MYDCRGRSGRQRPDRILVLQTGQARQRPARHGSSAYRIRNAYRRQDRRRLLRRAREGLMSSYSPNINIIIATNKVVILASIIDDKLSFVPNLQAVSTLLPL